MTEAVSALLVLCYGIFGWWLWQKAQSAGSSEPDVPEDDEPEFEYLSVQEQIETVRRTSDALAVLESLQAEIDDSTENDILPIHIEFMARNGETHELEVYCNGTNITAETLTDLVQAEIYTRKRTLAYQCEVLARQTRHRKNSRKNREMRGGERIDQILREVRGTHQDE